MISSSPTWAEILNALRSGIFRDLHVALPARVERFDSATQLVDVKPQINGTVDQEDGTTINVAIPVVTNVPVSFSAGGGFALTFPIQAGDTGLVVFTDRSMDAWQSGGGDTAPADLRRHHLSDAVFFPGIHPNNAALPAVDASAMVAGKASGASDFVALAGKVDSLFSALANAFSSWVVVPNDGGAALKALLTTLLLTWPTSSASGGLKAKG